MTITVPFTYEHRVGGRSVATIEDCAAVLMPDPHDPTDWWVSDVLIDGVRLPDGDPLNIAILCIWLKSPAMQARLEDAWRWRHLTTEAA